jgi:Fe-S-cluster-containing hydrogenase component 2
MKIRWFAKKCYGCRSCELACSFHHKRAFSPGGGSIQVSKNHGNGNIRWMRDASCDLCENEEKPLCVRFCSYQALQMTHEEGQDGYR